MDEVRERLVGQLQAVEDELERAKMKAENFPFAPLFQPQTLSLT